MRRGPGRAAGRTSWAVAITLIGLLSEGVTAQTAGEIEDAVALCIGLAPENEEARDQLEAWGNAALPFLEGMLAESFSQPDFHVVVAVGQIETQEAVDLLVAQLEAGGSWHHGQMVLGQLATMTRTRRGQLQANDRLQPVIQQRLETDRGWLTLGYAVELAADMGWKECVDAIRPLVEHDNVGLRDKAAKALHRLTGEEVVVERPAREFPAVDTGWLGLSRVGHLPTGAGMFTRASFASWPGPGGGRDVLVASSQSSLALLDASLEVVERVPIAGPSLGVFLLPREDTGDLQVVQVRRHTFFSKGAAVVGYDLEGRELWRREIDERTRSAAVLHLRGVVQGLVLGIGGEEGVVAIDLSGELLWQLEKRHVVYDVVTHPDLPNHVLIAGGGLEVVDAFGRPAQLDDGGLFSDVVGKLVPGGVRMLTSPRIYASIARVFPDASGQLSTIVAGSGNDSVTTLGRRDARGESVWSATLPSRITGLCLLEPEGLPRLVACTTQDGMLFLITEDGTLVFEERFATGDRISVQGLAAGRLDDAWYLTVSQVTSTLVYRVTRQGR